MAASFGLNPATMTTPPSWLLLGAIGTLGWVLAGTCLWAGVGRRIARRRHLAARADSNSQFRALLQSVEDYAVLTLDPYGIVASCNVGAERQSGLRSAGIVGRSFAELYAPEEIEHGIPAQDLKVWWRTAREMFG